MHFVWSWAKSPSINPQMPTRGWDQHSITTSEHQALMPAPCISMQHISLCFFDNFGYKLWKSYIITWLSWPLLCVQFSSSYYYPFPPVGPVLYHMELSVGGQQFHGKGRTRQAAKHDAAAKAIKYLQKEPILQQMAEVWTRITTLWIIYDAVTVIQCYFRKKSEILVLNI